MVAEKTSKKFRGTLFLAALCRLSFAGRCVLVPDNFYVVVKQVQDVMQST